MNAASRGAVVTAVAGAAICLAATRGAVAQSSPVGPLGAAHAVCVDRDAPLPRLAALLVADDPAVRADLRARAASSDVATRWCGIRGLAALRDPAVVDAVRQAWRDRPADAYLPARWAAYAAGGPAPQGERFAALVAALSDSALADATGDDGVRLLGEIDTAAARDAVLALAGRDDRPATVDAAVHALARHRDPRARARVTTLGQTVLNGLGGNAMFEEARRLAAAGFYLLVLGRDTRDAGLAMLSRLSPADQADVAAWAVQTLCEHGVRHPEARGDDEAVRTDLVDALASRGLRWDALERGTFPCPAAR